MRLFFSAIAALVPLASGALTIRLSLPKTEAPARRVYLTGEGAALCDWKPRCLPLRRLADQGGWARYETRVSATTPFRFKFTLGTWRSEALDSEGRLFPNFEWRPGGPSLVALRASGFADADAETRDSVRGRLHSFPYFRSRHLAHPRELTLWEPASFADRSVSCYRVLVAHDGENLFRASSSNYASEWRLDEALDAGLRSGRLPPTLVVASDSSAARAREYHYDGEGENYARFIVDELLPLVAARFPLCAGRHAVVGSSRGGLASFALLYRHPDVFARAAALSMHLADKRPFHLIFDEVPAPRSPLAFYMDHGDQGLDARYPEAARLFRRIFGERRPRDRIVYETYPGTAHDEASWAARLPRVLSFLLANEE